MRTVSKAKLLKWLLPFKQPPFSHNQTAIISLKITAPALNMLLGNGIRTSQSSQTSAS